MNDIALLWYLNRGTGLVLLVLLTITTVLGVLSMGGRAGGMLPRFVTQRLHRNLALISVAALAAHIATAVVDSYVDIRWWQAVVPVGATYQPLWLGLGTFALDIIMVVVVTSLLRHRLGHRTWRGVHLLSWLAWLASVVHAVGIGTDLRALSTWAVAPTAVCVVAVLAGGTLRLVRFPHSDRPRTLAGSRP